VGVGVEVGDIVCVGDDSSLIGHVAAGSSENDAGAVDVGGLQEALDDDCGAEFVRVVKDLVRPRTAEQHLKGCRPGMVDDPGAVEDCRARDAREHDRQVLVQALRRLWKGTSLVLTRVTEDMTATYQLCQKSVRESVAAIVMSEEPSRAESRAHERVERR